MTGTVLPAQWRPCKLEAGQLKEVAEWAERYLIQPIEAFVVFRCFEMAGRVMSEGLGQIGDGGIARHEARGSHAGWDRRERRRSC